MNKKAQKWPSAKNGKKYKTDVDFPAGLDVNSQPTMLSVLQSFHKTPRPRITFGFREQDPITDCISHLAFVRF